MKLKITVACILWLFVAMYTYDHHVATSKKRELKRELKREEMTFEQLHKMTE